MGKAPTVCCNGVTTAQGTIQFKQEEGKAWGQVMLVIRGQRYNWVQLTGTQRPRSKVKVGLTLSNQFNRPKAQGITRAGHKAVHNGQGWGLGL